MVSLGRYPVDRLAFVGLLFDCEASRMSLATYSGQLSVFRWATAKATGKASAIGLTVETLNCST